MKKVTIIGTFIIVALNADFIDTMVQKIKSPRESNISAQKLKEIPSPILEIPVDKNATLDENGSVAPEYEPNLETFILKAIMNNKAFINDKWVAIGEKIGDYKLVDIMDDSVYLTNGKKSKMVFFKNSHKKSIQIITK